MKSEDLRKFDTVVEAQSFLKNNGYSEEFDTRDGEICALATKNTYKPEDLKIIADARFEGMTNPGDNMALFVIIAKDGVKGSMITNMGGSESAQDPELLKRIPREIDEQSN